MSALDLLTETDNAAHADTAADQYITFRCAQTNYGVPIMSVREIRSWTPTVLIPGRNPAARGVMDIRGTVVEVFDLGALLGGTQIAASPGSVVLVLSLEERLVGVLVDAVSDIIQAGPSQLMPAPAHGVQAAEKIKWMVNYEDRLLAIVDLAAVFS